MPAPYSTEIVADVLRTYRQTRNSPFKTARLCGIEVADVFAIVDTNQGKLDAAHEHNGGLGREELIPYTVSRRRADDRSWDNTEPAIVKARADFEAGTHEMATGRDGKWLILYSIPRRRREPNRDGYFLPEQGQ